MKNRESLNSFENIFSIENVEKNYHEKISKTSTKGIDGKTIEIFEKEKNKEFEIIVNKCIAGEYRFSPYLEKLISKGRGKSPRVI